jgi:hypothetical protein
VIEATVDVDVKCFFTSVATGTVATVVTEGDGFGECNVEPKGSSNAGGHLGDFQGVGQPGALVVIGKDTYLSLASEPTKTRCVENAVTVTLKAGAPQIRLFFGGSTTTAVGFGGPGG